jgi:HSP20 family protein
MTPWIDPFEEMERMHRRIHRLIQRMWGGVWEPFREEVIRPVIEREFPIDIAETTDELIVRADLPGFDKEDVCLKVTETSLDLAAKKKVEKKEVTETMIRAERRAGTLRRVITLPTEVDPDSAKATFERGVLEVRLKKVKPVKKVREVKID